ncbi:MAG: hypothetical protein ACOX4B_03710 [Bacillota bacterium]
MAIKTHGPQGGTTWSLRTPLAMKIAFGEKPERGSYNAKKQGPL